MNFIDETRLLEAESKHIDPNTMLNEEERRRNTLGIAQVRKYFFSYYYFLFIVEYLLFRFIHTMQMLWMVVHRHFRNISNVLNQ